MNKQKKHIYIIGFMGSGKTTVGKLLAEQLNWPFMDTDSEIEEKTKKSVETIFKESGEEGFRQLETELLVELESHEPTVVAVGGGLPCYKNNIKALRDSGIVIYLNVSLLTLIKRLKDQRDFRPLLKIVPEEDLPRTIEKMLSDRVVFYKMADVFIPNEGNNPERPVADIRKELEKRRGNEE